MPIRVLSLDFDGCLFNDNYYRVFDNDVILANLSFLSQLRKERDIYTKTYTYIGSNRQSRALDVHNNNENGSESCFFAIQKINKYLTSVFVPLLTADIINDLIWKRHLYFIHLGYFLNINLLISLKLIKKND